MYIKNAHNTGCIEVEWGYLRDCLGRVSVCIMPE